MAGVYMYLGRIFVIGLRGSLGRIFRLVFVFGVECLFYLWKYRLGFERFLLFVDCYFLFFF